MLSSMMGFDGIPSSKIESDYGIFPVIIIPQEFPASRRFSSNLRMNQSSVGPIGLVILLRRLTAVITGVDTHPYFLPPPTPDFPFLATPLAPGASLRLEAPLASFFPAAGSVAALGNT